MDITICETDYQSRRYLRHSTQSWCFETTLQDGLGWEEGGEFRMGTHVHPWLIHVNAWKKKCYNIVK